MSIAKTIVLTEVRKEIEQGARRLIGFTFSFSFSTCEHLPPAWLGAMRCLAAAILPLHRLLGRDAQRCWASALPCFCLPSTSKSPTLVIQSCGSCICMGFLVSVMRISSSFLAVLQRVGVVFFFYRVRSGSTQVPNSIPSNSIGIESSCVHRD